MQLMAAPPGATTVINNKEVDYFCGTSYFSLHGHPCLIQAACDATKKYGLGSGTSRAGYGNNQVLLDVEEKAARFFEAERALYFVSGYLGSAILFQGLASQYEAIFVDQESHYSVMDGIAMVNKPTTIFVHRDPDDLRNKLQAKLLPGQRPLVISDGIFPASGEIAPLREYDQVLAEYDQALLCVDDAHATGVLGKKGQGTLEYCHVQGEGRYSTGTMSKAFGGHGGIITGSESFIDRLNAGSRLPIASSPVPIPAAAATAKSLEILTRQPELRQQLWNNVAYAKNAFRAIGFHTIPDTPVPIICLSANGVDLQAVQQHLFEKGIVVHYIPGGSYSSVPASGAIRIAIFSTHSREQIDRLAATLSSIL